MFMFPVLSKIVQKIASKLASHSPKNPTCRWPQDAKWRQDGRPQSDLTNYYATRSVSTLKASETHVLRECSVAMPEIVNVILQKINGGGQIERW
uniref:Uncharacterized protein n=1 Tax=Steinernema glaseri TaxID=37863 RepID=A0A1I8AAQ0_9BILA